MSSHLTASFHRMSLCGHNQPGIGLLVHQELPGGTLETIFFDKIRITILTILNVHILINKRIVNIHMGWLKSATKREHVGQAFESDSKVVRKHARKTKYSR